MGDRAVSHIGDYDELNSQLVTELVSSDVGRSVAFYQSLGFELGRRAERFATLRWGDRYLFVTAGQPATGGELPNIRIIVDDVDEEYRRVVARALVTDLRKPKPMVCATSRSLIRTTMGSASHKCSTGHPAKQSKALMSAFHPLRTCGGVVHSAYVLGVSPHVSLSTAVQAARADGLCICRGADNARTTIGQKYADSQSAIRVRMISTGALACLD